MLKAPCTPLALHVCGWTVVSIFSMSRAGCRGCRGPARRGRQGGWVSIHELLLSHSPAQRGPCTGPGLRKHSPAKGEQGRQGPERIIPKDTMVSSTRCMTGCESGFWSGGGRGRKRDISLLKHQAPATRQGKEPYANDQLLSV